ncbi:type IV pilus modification protein PilV [Nitrospira lenta]|nr:type IV pilus modification protein PilV [Nitrospira lenta]
MKACNEKGFTLVEVLVSAAILGVGVMGMAAMQGISFTKNVDANDLSVMTNVAADMMERIQGNRQYSWAYNNLDTAGAGNCLAGGIPAPRPALPFSSTDPTPPATRGIQGDCVQWRTLVLASNLLNPRGTVQVLPVLPAQKDSSAVQVTVRLQWTERTSTQRVRTVAFQTVIEPE